MLNYSKQNQIKVAYKENRDSGGRGQVLQVTEIRRQPVGEWGGSVTPTILLRKSEVLHVPCNILMTSFATTIVTHQSVVSDTLNIFSSEINSPIFSSEMIMMIFKG